MQCGANGSSQSTERLHERVGEARVLLADAFGECFAQLVLLVLDELHDRLGHRRRNLGWRNGEPSWRHPRGRERSDEISLRLGVEPDPLVAELNVGGLLDVAVEAEQGALPGGVRCLVRQFANIPQRIDFFEPRRHLVDAGERLLDDVAQAGGAALRLATGDGHFLDVSALLRVLRQPLVELVHQLGSLDCVGDARDP